MLEMMLEFLLSTQILPTVSAVATVTMQQTSLRNMLLLQLHRSKLFHIKRILLVVGIFYAATLVWFSFGSIRERLSIERLSLLRPSHYSNTTHTGIGGNVSESEATATVKGVAQSTTSVVAKERGILIVTPPRLFLFPTSTF